MDRGGEGHPVRAGRTKGGAAEGRPTLAEPCSGCGPFVSRRMIKGSHPSSSGKFIPTARADRPNAPGRSKTARSGAEVRTAGSGAPIRAPVSPTGPPISLSATTLPTKKSNRPHEEPPPNPLLPRQSAVSTHRKTRKGFAPAERLSLKIASGPPTAPTPFAAPTIPHGFPLLRRPPERKSPRRFGTGGTVRRPGHRIGGQPAF